MELFHGSLKGFNEFNLDFCSYESRMGKGIYLSSDYNDSYSYTLLSHSDVKAKLSSLAEVMLDEREDLNFNEAYDLVLEKTESEIDRNLYVVKANIKNPIVICNDSPSVFCELKDIEGDPENPSLDDLIPENFNRFISFLHSFEGHYVYFENEIDQIYDVLLDYGCLTHNDIFNIFVNSDSQLDVLNDDGEMIFMTELFGFLLKDGGYDAICDKRIQELELPGVDLDTVNYTVTDLSLLEIVKKEDLN